MLKDKGQSLRDLMEANSPQVVHQKIREMLWAKEPKIKPQDFSFREIWESMQNLQEQVAATAFPVITGELINKAVMEGYEDVPAIGEQLVKTIPSNRRTEKLVGWEALEKVKEVLPGMPYEESSMAEKFVDINNAKYGRILAITEEAVMEEQTGQILDRAAEIGRTAREMKEYLILITVQDLNSKAFGGSALYTSDHGNLGNTALGADGAGLKAAKKLLFAMKDEQGKPILSSGRGLLVPIDLEDTAFNLIKPPILPGVTVEPGSAYYAQLIGAILCSPYMANATAYYYGDFKRQFRWCEVWPIQVFRRGGQQTEAGWNRDVLAQFKVRMYGGCGAIDYKFVIKGTS